MSKSTLVRLFVSLVLVSTAVPLWAQTSTGSIAGTVKDATGAVLPGVTVEASSPALIEKLRSVVTDSEGQYRIVELPPGTYAVTATLSGFSASKREGIVLTSGFAAAVNLELKVGDVAETITVSGATPIVDVQNVKRAAVVTREMLDVLPTGKQFQDVGMLVPGMARNGSDVGGQAGQSYNMMGIHGGRIADMRIQVDGMGLAHGGAQNATPIQIAEGNYEEFSYDLSSGPAESETGGVRINLVPKQGGNTLKGR